MSERTATKKAVSRKDMTKAQWTWKEMKRNWVAYVMVAPYMILFTLFTVVPVVLSIFISFTDFNMLEWPNFVFLDNYITLFFDDDIFLIAVKNTFIFAVIVGPASYLMSYMVAWFINELPPKIRAVVTLIFYAPSISGQVYLIWGTLFSSDSYGWVNATLLKLGLIDKEILFFQDEKYVMPLCIIVSLWTSLGTSFLAFIAGLQGVDRSLYEAGAVDGVKNRWQELWYITLPEMKHMLLFSAVMQIASAYSISGIIQQLAGYPTVKYAADTLVSYLQDVGTVKYEMGYAAALSVILFLMMVATRGIANALINKTGR